MVKEMQKSRLPTWAIVTKAIPLRWDMGAVTAPESDQMGGH
jgi:hypothetical protein